MSSAALRRPTMTTDEFLAWDEGQEGRWEFDGFAPVAMTGGTLEHAAIAHNLHRAVGGRLPEGGRCRFYGADVRVRTGSGQVRVPDGLVLCGPRPRGTNVVGDPVVVFEVLSESTAGVDRGRKVREYRDTPPILRYVILEQDRPGAMVFAREAGTWIGRVLDAGDALAMPEVGIEAIPLAELYRGVPLDDGPGDPG